MKYSILGFILFGFCAQALPVAPLSLPKLARKTSFQETYNRYPSPFGIIQQLRHIIPHMPNSAGDACLTISSSSAPAIGTIDPLQGTALEEEPSALFYPYFANCVRSLGPNGFYSAAAANAKEILGDELAAELNDSFENDCKDPKVRPIICHYEATQRPSAFWYGVNWKDLPEDRRLKFMAAFIDYLVGPEAVLRQKELIGKESVFGVELNSIETLTKFLNDEMTKLKDGEAALSVMQIYFETAILLRLGPALKN